VVTTKKVSLASLVFDFDFYPRTQVDSQHVSRMVDAHHAGATFPPLIADNRSSRVVDGFHRGRMYKRLEIEKVEVEFRQYPDDAAMLLDAVRFNAGHGRSLSPFDRSHVVILADKLGVDNGALATALSLTPEKVESLRVKKTAVVSKQRVALKSTISHMAGKRLTKQQAAANDRLGGMRQLFYVNQVAMLIEADLIEKDNEELMEGLRKLHGLLEGMLVA
jgi:hypothetical protein